MQFMWSVTFSLLYDNSLPLIGMIKIDDSAFMQCGGNHNGCAPNRCGVRVVDSLEFLRYGLFMVLFVPLLVNYYAIASHRRISLAQISSTQQFTVACRSVISINTTGLHTNLFRVIVLEHERCSAALSINVNISKNADI